MSITQITNFDELARARMLEQFSSACAPNIDKLVNIFIQEIQEIENQLFELLNNRNVSNAIGAQLDILGDIVGIDREGRDDNDYRDAINVQIQVNNTGGQEPAIAALLGILTTATIIDIIEVFPAGLDININAADLSVGTIELLRKAISATISLQFSQATDTSFAFSGSSVGDGFGNLVTPTDGGVFAFVVTA